MNSRCNRDMDKDYIEDLLLGYFAGESTEKEQQELLDWLKADPVHEKAFSQMADWWAISHVPRFTAQVEVDFKKHFAHIFHDQQKPQRRLFAFSRNMAAAVLLLLLVGGVSFVAGWLSIQTPEIASVSFTQIEAPMGGSSKVLLPDGTAVWINGGSTLTYSSEFNQSVREITLSGEAFFDVKRDESRPFIVKSDVVELEVLGTSFNVRAYGNEPELDISLITGKVDVQINAPDLTISKIRLAPEQMLSFNRETSSVEMSTFHGKDAISWISGQMSFSNASFSRIARSLERKFNVQIEIESKYLTKEFFTGTFPSTHTLNQILKEMDVDQKYCWTLKDNKLIIQDK